MTKPQFKLHTRQATLLILAAAALFIGRPAHAQTNITWSASAGTVTWATAANWQGGTAPTSNLTSNIAVFDSTSYSHQPTIASGTSISIAGVQFGDGSTATAGSTVTVSGTLNIGASGITMEANAGPATFTSGTIRLGAIQSWTNNSSSLLTISSAVTNALTTTGTLTVAGSGTGGETFNGVISDGTGAGTTALTINTTAGVTTLAATNTYTGGTILTSGTVVVTNVQGLGATTSALGLEGGVLDLKTSTSIAAYNVSVFGNPTEIISDSATDVNQTFGTLSIGSHTLTGSGGAGGDHHLTFGATTTTSPVFNAVGNDVITFGALQSNGGRIIVESLDATGTVIFGTAANLARVSGTVTLNSGTMQLNGAGGETALGTTGVLLQLNGGTLDLQLPASVNAYNTTVDDANTTILSDLTAPGAGITDTLGTLSIGSQTLSVSGGVSATSGSANLTFGATTLTGNPTFNVSNSGSGAVTVLTLGALNDSGTARTITKTGGASLTLTGSATSLVAGTKVKISSGTLNSNAAAALGTLAQVDIADGAVFNVGASQTISALTDSTTVNHTASVVIGAFTLTVGSTDNLNSTFTGAISGASGALTKAGTGTLTLSGSNSYGGGTKLNAGTLNFGNVNALGTGSVTIGNATLQAGVAGTLANNIVIGTGSTGTLSNTSGGLLTLSGTLTKAGAVLTLGSGTFNVTGQITGGGTNTFNSDFDVNGGTVTVSATNNNYTGPTLVYNGGTLINGTTNALPTGTVLTTGSSSDGAVANTYDLHGFDQTVAALNSVSAGGNSNFVTNNAVGSGTNTLTLSGSNSDNAAVSGNFGGTIQNGASAVTALTITGASVQTLSGSSSYTGATAVLNGALNLTGQLGSTTVTVGNAGTGVLTPTLTGGFGNNGTTGTSSLMTPSNSPALQVYTPSSTVGNITGTVIVNGPGSGSAGNLFAATEKVTTLTIGNVTLNAGSILNWQFSATANSFVNVTGLLTLPGAGTVGINLFNEGLGTSWTPVTGTYDLFQYGTLSGSAGSLSVLNPNNNYSYDFETAVSGGTNFVTLTIGTNILPTAYWSGTQDNNWNTLNSGSSNFNTTIDGGTNTGRLPGTLTNVVFDTTTPAAASLATTLGGTSVVINSLTFSGSAGANGAASISSGGGGATLTILATGTTGNTAGNGINVETGAASGNSISAGVVLGGTQAWTVTDGTNTFTVSGNVTDGGNGYSLTKLGAGTLVLSGSNTYSGTTTISSGTLQLANTFAAQNSTVTVSAANGLQFGTGASSYTIGGLSGAGNFVLSDTSNNPITLTAGGNNAPTTYSGTMSGGGGLTKSGTGALTLSASNSYSGGTTLTAGTLNYGNLNALGSGTLNMGTATLQAGLSGTLGNNIVLGSGSTGTFDTQAFTETLSGAISGSGALTKISAGTLTLSAGNNFTGATTISAGVLLLDNAMAAQNSTVTVSVNNGLQFGTGTSSYTIGGLAGTGNFVLSDTSSNPITLTAGGNNAPTTYSGTMSGGGGLTKSGTGALTLSASNSYSGGTTLTAGTLNYGNLNALGSGTLNMGTATLQAGLSGTLGNNIVLGSGSTGTFDTQAFTETLSGAISGSGALTKISAGTLTLSASNSYSGGTTLTAGTLNYGNLNALGSGTLNMGTATLQAGVAGTLGNNIVIGSGSTGSFDASLFNMTLGGGISDGGGVGGVLAKTTAGTLTLSASNSYSGGTTLTSGTLNYGNLNALGSGTLNMGTATLQAGVSGTLGNNIVLGSGSTGTFDTQAFTETLSGAISGSGALTKISAGTLTLTGSNTYTGGTTLTSGTLVAGNVLALGGTTSALVLNGGVLDLATDTSISAYNTTIGGNVTIVSDTISGTGVAQTLGTLNIGASTLTATRGAGVTTGTPRVVFGATTVAANGTVFDAENVLLTIGALQDNGSFTVQSQDGTGNIRFNAFPNAARTSGTVTLSSGNLQINNVASALGSTGVVLQLNGGTLDLQLNSSVSAYNTTVGGNVTILSDQTAAGAGITDTLGTLSIGSQTLSVSGGVSATSGSANLTFGATTLTGSATFNVTNNAGGAVTVLTLGALNDSGTARTITKTGGASLTLTGSATSLVAGTKVKISSGTLNSNAAAALGTLAQVDIADGAVFNVGASQTISALTDSTTVNHTASVVIGAFTLTVGSTDNLNSTFTGAISGASGALTKAGTGTLTLSGSNSYGGGTTIGSGTLQIGAGGTAGSIGSTSGVSVSSGATLAFDRSDNYGGNFTRVISGFGGVVLTTGSLTLSSTETYSGATTIRAGTLTIGGAGELGSGNYAGSIGNSGTFIYNSSVAQTLSGSITGSGALIQQGAGRLTLTGSNSYGGATVVVSGTLEVDGSLSGSSAVTVNVAALSGTGTVNGTVTLTGTSTLLSAGTLTLAQGFTVSGANNVIASGSISGYASQNAGSALAVNGVLSGSDTLANGATNLSGIGTVGVVAMNGGGNVVSSSGTLATGGITVSGSGNTIGGGTVTGAVTQNAGSALTVTGNAGSDALGVNASLAGTGFLGATTLTGTDTLSSAVTLTVASLGVSGGGNTISGGTVNATGGTTINSGGNLAVNSTLSGTVGVSGVLSGTGTLTGPVTVSAGGVTSPGVGSAPGVLTSDLAYSASSTANFNVASGSSAAPQANLSKLYYSQMVVTGGSGAVSLGIGTGVTLGANSATSIAQTGSQIQGDGSSNSGVTLQLTISSADYTTLLNNAATTYNAKSANSGLDNYFVFNLGSTLSTGRFTTLDINGTSGTIYYSGALDRFAADGVDNTIGDVYIGSQEFALSYTGVFLSNSTIGGNDIVLTAIPEPGTWGMILGGFGMLIGFQRLRKRRMGI